MRARRGLLGVVGFLSLSGCNPSHQSAGERLARQNCAACHAFPDPQLLSKSVWQKGVLPQMAPRLGVSTKSLFDATSRNPNMTVLKRAVSDADWEKIVAYYLEHAPDTLPPQSLPAEPQRDPGFFKVAPLVPRLQSSGIITLLKTDTAHQRIYVGEAGTNMLRIFDFNRRLISQQKLASPPTDVIVDSGRVLLLESGILDPNDEPKGSLIELNGRVLIDSLYRPVFVRELGPNEFLICEYGDNRGRLALYRLSGSRYTRQVLDNTPGAIRFEMSDLTGDGQPDIVALFAQGDERIVLFPNDGHGNYTAPAQVLARFPPVYGSMYFTLRDFNGDGHPDIVYVNGDNFDYSRVLKPYHGVRILENDGHNNFVERYFFPIYGAARAEVADFDGDGDLDILTTSNFADAGRHPERSIMYLENTGGYVFKPYAFTVASANQWNLIASADLNHDGLPDAIVGAMHLENIARVQRFSGQGLEAGPDPLLVFQSSRHDLPHR